MKETAKIYIDIASLLDLRAAALSQLGDQEKLVEYLNTEEYNFRQMDEFPLVDMEQYKRLDKEKPVNLIPASVITYLLTSLKSKLHNLEQRNNFYNEKKIPEVLLNIYPFKLTNTQSKALQNMLFVKLETNTLVTVISMSPKDVTPYFIKNSGIITAFMYSFKDWMNEHGGVLETNKLPDTIMYFPALYHEKHDEKELQKITKLGFKDLFGYTEYLLSSCVNINFLPVVFYSNLITASLYIDKFNDVLKDEKLSTETEQEKDNGNSSPAV